MIVAFEEKDTQTCPMVKLYIYCSMNKQYIDGGGGKIEKKRKKTSLLLKEQNQKRSRMGFRKFSCDTLRAQFFEGYIYIYIYIIAYLQF